MSIDIFTFVAQVFNFALLIYLLRRFLYRPVQEAMRRREEMISGRLADAAQERETAEALASEYRERVNDLDDKADDMIAEARARADELATELSASLRQRMAEQERDWRATQARHAEEELAAFREGVREEVSSTLRAALSDLADEDLEARMIARFLARIEALSDEEVQKILPSDDDLPRFEVVTTYPIGETTEKEITDALEARFGVSPRTTFDVDPSRIAGIELVCKGHRLGWSIADYLESLNETVRREIQSLTHQSPAAHAS